MSSDNCRIVAFRTRTERRGKARAGHIELAFRSLNTPSSLGSELLSSSKSVMEFSLTFRIGFLKSYVRGRSDL